MNDRIVRIGGASGFWGDSAEAAPQLVKSGNLDYLTFDYLAELTMSILSRARAQDPEAGYARDFVEVAMASVLREVVDKGIKVLSNAGGVNPRACAEALQRLAQAQGLTLKIAVVEGDDALSRLDEFRAEDVRDIHSGQPLPVRVMSANAYLGALPIVEALQQGAQVVITGRCVDSALPLAALMHEFGWSAQEYDLLAAGSLAGHLIECGPQATGGLFTDWETVEGWDNIGYPIVECRADGSFVLTKPAGSGGLVTPATVGEQMLYEIGDPANYLLPDVRCDFTAVRMTAVGPDRVLVEGARGQAPSPSYKVSATYADGWRCVANITLIGGRAERKAQRVSEAILARTRRMLGERGLGDYSLVYSEVLGTEASFGPHSRVAVNREVVLRLVVEHKDRNALELFAAELAPGGVSWAPGMTSIGGGRPRPSPIVKLFSFLAPKTQFQAQVWMNDEHWPVAIPVAPQQAADVGPAANYAELPSPTTVEPVVEVPLLRIAHGRSGDKGNSVNIGIIAREPKWLGVLRDELTAERVREYFGHFVEGQVSRFDVPGIGAFNFLLQGALAGGGMASPRSDPLGKAFAQMLLDMPIRVPAKLLEPSPAAE
ncbi:acyclic terpene utilization AtuA family protein [Pseudomonas sp. NPDC077186]|uniref:acyclic terpene utilization AtuA family protein n=1 Tax=Pseudomonas sp. NPDC077186 TaxID=3364421 RepID=UPI0037CCB112